MLQNLKEAKASNHKKNKSEQFKKPHNREFSIFQEGQTKQGARMKAAAIFKKEEDFFEFQDTDRQNEVELQYLNDLS